MNKQHGELLYLESVSHRFTEYNVKLLHFSRQETLLNLGDDSSQALTKCVGVFPMNTADLLAEVVFRDIIQGKLDAQQVQLKFVKYTGGCKNVYFKVVVTERRINLTCFCCTYLMCCCLLRQSFKRLMKD